MSLCLVITSPVLIHFQKKQNTMPQTKYIARLNWHDVRPVTIVRETENSYWTEKEPSKKRSKRTDHEKLCDTEQEAQTYILDLFKEEIQRAENRLSQLKFKYSELVKKFVF